MNTLLDLSNPRNPFPWIANSELSLPPAGVIFPEYYNAIMGWRVPIAIIALYVTVVETANSRVKVEKVCIVGRGSDRRWERFFFFRCDKSLLRARIRNYFKPYCLLLAQLSRVVASSKGKVDAKAKSNSSPIFTALIFLHNTALCIYSAWTFYHSASALRASYANNNFWDAVGGF